MGEGKLTVAIDGPSGVGKSTVSRLVAARLHLKYVDTGAMYRAVALAVFDRGIDTDDDEALAAFIGGLTVAFDSTGEKVFLNGEDLSSRIREDGVGETTSLLSSKSVVRRLLVKMQRGLASSGGVVMEGRDVGTVVMPGADVKIFLDASNEVRAARRHGDFVSSSGDNVPELSKVMTDIKERDRRDSTREDSPLKMAEDALRVDTSETTIDAVVGRILDIIRERTGVGDTRC